MLMELSTHYLVVRLNEMINNLLNFSAPYRLLVLEIFLYTLRLTDALQLKKLIDNW